MILYDNETNVIKIVAKDTGDFVISLTGYELAEGDIVYFTVNDEVEKENPLIQKVITDFVDGKAIVKLTSQDTNLPVGDYLYDVEVDTADGRVDTIIRPKKFKILGGVKF